MDTARSLAADMVEEVGWLPAVAEAVDLLLAARSWWRVRQGVRLLVAVVFA